MATCTNFEDATKEPDQDAGEYRRESRMVDRMSIDRGSPVRREMVYPMESDRFRSLEGEVPRGWPGPRITYAGPPTMTWRDEVRYSGGSGGITGSSGDPLEKDLQVNNAYGDNVSS